MCGIAGYVGNAPPRAQAIDSALSLMRRRGPDIQRAKAYEFPDCHHVVLLHARLRIIDLDSRADQPFNVANSAIVYNGELYNYREIRAQLKSAGHQFISESDTEVMSRAISHWGTQAFDKFEGMWSLARLDLSTGAILLSRDRFGEKPLYILRQKHGFYFGSEIKFLLALSGISPDLDWSQLSRYLVNGYKSLYKQPATFYSNVEEFPAASFAEAKTDGLSLPVKFWSPAYAPDARMSFNEAVEEIRLQLIRAVELRLRSDVPVAFCMSGGVDSIALISIAQKISNSAIHGFTAVNSDERYDEWPLVEETVQQLELSHTAIPTDTSGFLDGLRTLVSYHDAPVYTISYYAHWLLQQQISKHGYRVSISGTGADELFSGYYDHHLLYMNAVQDDEKLLNESIRNWRSYIKPVVRNPFLQDPRAFIDNPNMRDHIFLNSHEMQEYLTTPWHEPFTEHCYTPSLLRNRMMNELFHEAVPAILHEDDLNAMYYSVENRSPFLDRCLFEFSMRIPDRHLVRDGKAKIILREAVRGLAPTSVINNRRKVGFNAPILHFLNHRDPHVRETLLDDSIIFQHVRRDRIESLLDEDELPNSKSKFLFYFISAKFFVEAHS